MNAVTLADQAKPRTRPGPWVERAACRGYDTNIWFPRKGDFVTSQKAKEICSRCEVIVECGELARVNREGWGVWGGESIKDRRGKPYIRLRAEAS